MPVSEHPIIVTFTTPFETETIRGYNRDEVMARAVAFAVQRLPTVWIGTKELEIEVETRQPGVAADLRSAIRFALDSAKRLDRD